MGRCWESPMPLRVCCRRARYAGGGSGGRMAMLRRLPVAASLPPLHAGGRRRGQHAVNSAGQVVYHRRSGLPVREDRRASHLAAGLTGVVVARLLEWRAMKFLCLDCDEPMKLHSTEGPDEGSLAVTFRCPTCGFRVAMLANPFETQLGRSLGVKVGGRTAPPEPFEHLRASLAEARPDAFQGTGTTSQTPEPGCPFAAALGESVAVPAQPTPVA